MQDNPTAREEVKIARDLLHTMSGLISAARYGLHCCKTSEDRESTLSCIADIQAALNESATVAAKLRASLHALDELLEPE
jgi:hypothetical protein